VLLQLDAMRGGSAWVRPGHAVLMFDFGATPPPMGATDVVLDQTTSLR
jgi:hypothetical protein